MTEAAHKYIIEHRAGDPDLSIPEAWVILAPTDESGIKYEHIAFVRQEGWAHRIVSALVWQDVLGQGRVSLAQQGIEFDQETGRPWCPPKILQKPQPKAEIKRARKPRKKS